MLLTNAGSCACTCKYLQMQFRNAVFILYIWAEKNTHINNLQMIFNNLVVELNKFHFLLVYVGQVSIFSQNHRTVWAEKDF